MYSINSFEVRRFDRLALWGVGVLALLLWTCQARAADPGCRLRIEPGVAAARAAFARGEYRGALAGFEAAFGRCPVAALLYLIGRAAEEAGQRDRAIVAYRGFLSGPWGTPAQREDAARRLAAMVTVGPAKPAAPVARTPAPPPPPQVRDLPAARVVAPRPASTYQGGLAWSALGIGAAGVIVSVALLGLDGQSACVGEPRCPALYDTRAAGIALGIGGALLVGAGGGALLFLRRGLRR